MLDIETTTDHRTIHLVVTKDIDSGEINTWKQASSLVEYLRDTTLIVAHNGVNFDFPILNRLCNTRIRWNQTFDTLIASRLLDPSREQGHSLEAWGKTLGTQKIDYTAVWKWINDYTEKNTNGEEFNKPHMPLLETYCIRDVEVTEKLYHHLLKELEEKKFSQESIDLEHKVAAIIAEQTRNGFKLDRPYATSLLADIQGKMDAIYEQMQQRWPPYEIPRVSEKTGKQLKPLLVTFNPGSRKQIGEKLIELGWKPKQFTEGGQAQVDESILDQIIKDCEK